MPSQIVIGVDYVANRSTHLPWAGTNNRDFISSSLLAQISRRAWQHALERHRLRSADSCVTNFLNTLVGNPFFAMFNHALHANLFQSLLQ